MITRKRGRVNSNSTDDVCSSPSQESTNALKAEDSESGRNEQTSPESDSNDWGLDDLLTSDLSWAFNVDELSSFPDIGMQDPAQSSEEQTDQASDVSISHNRGLVQRRQLQDLSGRINKNAMAARMNRLKKKEYLSGLEQRVGSLTSENRLLKQENNSLSKRVEELENETRYLRAVLANESMLAQLLSRLSGMNGMKFSTSLFQESNESDHDYAIPRKRVKVEDKGAAGGVCLHVDKDHVSVEFCTKCAESASSSLKMCLVCPAGRVGLRTSKTT